MRQISIICSCILILLLYHGVDAEMQLNRISLKGTTEPKETTAPSAGFLAQLLGSEYEMDDFLDEYLEIAPLYVPYNQRSRDDRVSWIQSYRRLLPGKKIDKLLYANASAFPPFEKLKMGKDVQLTRFIRSVDRKSKSSNQKFQWKTAQVFNFWPQVAHNDSIILSGIQEAFSEGFTIHLKKIDARIKHVASVCRSLETFFGVPVQADMRFSPFPKDETKSVGPTFFANDFFLIQISGKQTIHLYSPVEKFPYDHQLYDVQNELESKDANPDIKLSLDEGDVLYVPRGWIITTQSLEEVSMDIQFFLACDNFTYRDAIVQSMLSTEDPVFKKDLDEKAYGSTSEKVLWKDVLVAAIKVAADLTPDMRLLFPHSPVYAYFRRESNRVKTSMGDLSYRISKFSGAIEKSFFEPFLNVLATGEAGDQYCNKVVRKWAKEVLRDSDMFDHVHQRFAELAKKLPQTANLEHSRVYFSTMSQQVCGPESQSNVDRDLTIKKHIDNLKDTFASEFQDDNSDDPKDHSEL